MSTVPPSHMTIRPRPQTRKAGVPSQARARPPPLGNRPDVRHHDRTTPLTPIGLRGFRRPGRGGAPDDVGHLLAAVEASRLPGGRPATAGGDRLWLATRASRPHWSLPIVSIERSGSERTETHETYPRQHTLEGSPKKHVVRGLRFVAEGACMDGPE